MCKSVNETKLMRKLAHAHQLKSIEILETWTMFDVPYLPSKLVAGESKDSQFVGEHVLQFV